MSQRDIYGILENANRSMPINEISRLIGVNRNTAQINIVGMRKDLTYDTIRIKHRI